jgi:hypothetical protein
LLSAPAFVVPSSIVLQALSLRQLGRRSKTDMREARQQLGHKSVKT